MPKKARIVRHTARELMAQRARGETRSDWRAPARRPPPRSSRTLPQTPTGRGQ